MRKILPKLNQLFPSFLILLVVSSVAISCKKNDLSNDLKHKTKSNKKPDKATIIIEPYNSVIYDSCRAEYVILSGVVEYKLIESFKNGYYINYEIKLEKVTGVGEKTGTIYHGGGKILGVVKLTDDGMDQTSRTSYKVKYVANNGNQITFNQTSKFIVRNTVVKVETNYILDSCK